MLMLYGMLGVFFLWLVIIIYLWRNDDLYGFEDVIATFILVVIIASGVFWGFLTFGLSWTGNYHEKVGEYKLVALKDTGSVEGSFFLGTGYFQGSAAYRYYYQLDENIIAMNQRSFSDGFITYITDGSKPRVVTTKEHFKSGFLNHLFWDVKGYEDTYYVPEGSVLNEIRLDLE